MSETKTSTAQNGLKYENPAAGEGGDVLEGALVAAVPRAKHRFTFVSGALCTDLRGGVPNGQPPETGVAPSQKNNDALRMTAYVGPA